MGYFAVCCSWVFGFDKMVGHATSSNLDLPDVPNEPEQLISFDFPKYTGITGDKKILASSYQYSNNGHLYTTMKLKTLSITLVYMASSRIG